MSTLIPGTDAKLFDCTIVSVDGSVEYGPIVRLRFNNGSLGAGVSMTPTEALKLSADLAKIADDVIRADAR